MLKADQHPFLTRPTRTLMTLSVPIILSLIAEPVTGIVDTAFVAQLGAAPLAALGIGTTLLSTILWVFNFLGISAQTEVAHALGAENRQRGVEVTSVALIMGTGGGLLLIVLGLLFSGALAGLLGASGEVHTLTVQYMQIRLFSLPAVMVTLIGFGALRGLQDMRTPFLVAVTVNGLNIALDALLVPTQGVSGAALATVISQWVGAAWTVRVVFRSLGFIPHFNLKDARALLRVGSDLFLRTGLLTLFLLLSTRVANQIGQEAGAAHQALRTVFLFSGFLTDGFGATAQSLVGYFLGARRVDVARQAAALAIRCGAVSGVVLTLLLLAGTSIIAGLLVPVEALALFHPAWLIMIALQPVAAVAFITDGIHWGTGDYTFIRNVMFLATLCAAVVLLSIDTTLPGALNGVWFSYVVLISLRGFFGVLRVWPGFGQSPLRPALT